MGSTSLESLLWSVDILLFLQQNEVEPFQKVLCKLTVSVKLMIPSGEDRYSAKRQFRNKTKHSWVTAGLSFVQFFWSANCRSDSTWLYRRKEQGTWETILLCLTLWRFDTTWGPVPWNSLRKLIKCTQSHWACCGDRQDTRCQQSGHWG